MEMPRTSQRPSAKGAIGYCPHIPFLKSHRDATPFQIPQGCKVYRLGNTKRVQAHETGKRKPHNEQTRGTQPKRNRAHRQNTRKARHPGKTNGLFRSNVCLTLRGCTRCCQNHGIIIFVIFGVGEASIIRVTVVVLSTTRNLRNRRCTNSRRGCSAAACEGRCTIASGQVTSRCSC
jgi:hypothetical protein